jgi:hypothetical protein
VGGDLQVLQRHRRHQPVPPAVIDQLITSIFF